MFDVAFWPWWLGAAAMASVVLVCWRFERRQLGVSGSLSRILKAYVQEREHAEAARAMAEMDSDDLEALMEQAMLEAMGELDMELPTSEPEEDLPDPPKTQHPPWAPHRHLVFLGMVIVGGTLGAVLDGRWGAGLEIDATYASLTHTSSFTGWLMLFAGGLLVGFGTRMAGGCTVGHGLCGMGRMQPGSIVSTGAFFGAAVGLSFVLAALL